MAWQKTNQSHTNDGPFASSHTRNKFEHFYLERKLWIKKKKKREIEKDKIKNKKIKMTVLICPSPDFKKKDKDKNPQ